MLHLAILTIALASGDCPECDRGAWRTLAAPGGQYDGQLPRAAVLVPPPPLLKYPSIAYWVPCPCVRCVGQNCFSTTRPYLPGVPVFNYRQDFNYPWSQAPSNLRPLTVPGKVSHELIEVPTYAPVAVPVPTPIETEVEGPVDAPEVVPAPPWEGRHKSKSKGTITARRTGGVLVSDQVRPADKRWKGSAASGGAGSSEPREPETK
jgi:hypothetical protein